MLQQDDRFRFGHALHRIGCWNDCQRIEESRFETLILGGFIGKSQPLDAAQIGLNEAWKNGLGALFYKVV